ncbi:hypothetical protein GCM10028807_36180 [Spirosoma daeguense]
MNKLFFEYLDRYTRNPVQLIIIDNASTDGSGDFFAEQGATVIRNEENYSYPHCQNQGLEIANGEIIAFLNNDLLVSPDWDIELMFIMDNKGYDFLTPASNDRLETQEATKTTRRRWNWIKNLYGFLGGYNEKNLIRMCNQMYGDWEWFQRKRYDKFHHNLIEGFSGSCLVATEKGLNKIGRYFDPKIQSADFDFYLRTKKQSITVGDVKPIHVALGVYFHHYTRMTSNSKDYLPFVDNTQMITLQEKWGEDLKKLTNDIDA